MDYAEKLIGKLTQSFSSAVEKDNSVSYPCVKVQSGSLIKVLKFCQSELALVFLEDITAIDLVQNFSLIYRVVNLQAEALVLKVEVQKNKTLIASAVSVWPSARLFQLEVREMFGIAFEPDESSESLLLPEGWLGHPLRKDYTYPREFEGLEHQRPALRKEYQRP